MPCPDVQYSINGKKDIKISGRLRETAFEVMFPEDNDHLGLPYIILDTILKCPLDIRRELAENLFLIGGSTMVMGLMARLKVELLELLKSNMYKNKLFFDSVKFHTAPAKANFTAWLGGTICLFRWIDFRILSLIGIDSRFHLWRYRSGTITVTYSRGVLKNGTSA